MKKKKEKEKRHTKGKWGGATILQILVELEAKQD